jgi:pimeloyl-ACP methyl ester carboxylesterase
MKLFGVLGALATGALVAACSNNDKDNVSDSGTPDAAHYPNLPGGNPLVPEVAAFPFPSDFYTVKDSSTRTGRRVSIPAEVLPNLMTPAMFSDADGFSRIPPILTYLPGGFDPGCFPVEDADPLGKSSPVVLVKLGSWEKVPILVETDLSDTVPSRRALIIRPLVALEWKAGYAVILLDSLRDAEGQPHRAGAAFAALRDSVTTTVPAIEQQREDFEQVNAAIAALKLDPARVVLAWSFHVRSEEAVTSTLLAMHDHANTAQLGGYTVTSDSTETEGSATNRQIVGTFKAPDFIGSDGLINLDAGGKPKPVGEQDVEFRLTIPSTIDGPRPVILFGHGFFGSPEEGTRGSFNELCREKRFSAVGTYVGFNERNKPLALAGLVMEPARLHEMTANVQQNIANYTTLARLVKEVLVNDLQKDDGSGPFKVVDPSQVHYMGISNGSTFGYVVTATSPQLTRSVLVVGGGGLVHFLQRAEPWNKYAFFYNTLYKDSKERQLAFSLTQQVVDPIDSMSYADRLVTNRHPGRKPLVAAIHMAVNDSQVRNLVTEWVVRSAKIPMITPSPRAIWGLQTITAAPTAGAPAGTPGALFVYDEKLEPPPAGNLPPAKDNDGHESIRKLSVYKQQVAEFIENGKLVQVCSGACDPD